MNTLRSFHNDKQIKKQYVTRVLNHQKADEIIQGKYWENGKGCAVGCTIHGSDHSKYETELGIPKWLALLEDKIFEGLSPEDAKRWPAQFLRAVPVGKDLGKIKIPFLIFIVKSALSNVNKSTHPKQHLAITNVLKELRRKTIDFEKLRVARQNAADAAYAAYAADAAAYAAAYAADAAYAAADAADAAYAADAAADAKRSAYLKFAKELLRLLRGLK